MFTCSFEKIVSMINNTLIIFFSYTIVLIIFFWIIPTKKSKVIVDRITKLMNSHPFTKILEVFKKTTHNKSG